MASRDVPFGLDNQPYRYRGHNGNKYAASRGIAYGPEYGIGDIVGGGVDFDTNTALFTKNGEYLGK